mmetsp:Transcript_31386/g.63655  ORF Transcript_31386/g.63655 Transcript_31386/m.63655 type:complete len:201 (+) Transcript_31386:384-986(+)
MVVHEARARDTGDDIGVVHHAEGVGDKGVEFVDKRDVADARRPEVVHGDLIVVQFGHVCSAQGRKSPAEGVSCHIHAPGPTTLVLTLLQHLEDIEQAWTDGEIRSEEADMHHNTLILFFYCLFFCFLVCKQPSNRPLGDISKLIPLLLLRELSKERLGEIAELVTVLASELSDQLFREVSKLVVVIARQLPHQAHACLSK